jgi:hypothetical protein
MHSVHDRAAKHIALQTTALRTKLSTGLVDKSEILSNAARVPEHPKELPIVAKWRSQPRGLERTLQRLQALVPRAEVNGLRAE